ncbi:hypothetical protein TruAng_003812 [Truncatella angustata]|nr:hypothetical protein TruAng_003812 [Truncatella angustata]
MVIVTLEKAAQACPFHKLPIETRIVILSFAGTHGAVAACSCACSCLLEAVQADESTITYGIIIDTLPDDPDIVKAAYTTESIAKIIKSSDDLRECMDICRQYIGNSAVEAVAKIVGREIIDDIEYGYINGPSVYNYDRVLSSNETRRVNLILYHRELWNILFSRNLSTTTVKTDEPLAKQFFKLYSPWDIKALRYLSFFLNSIVVLGIRDTIVELYSWNPFVQDLTEWQNLLARTEDAEEKNALLCRAEEFAILEDWYKYSMHTGQLADYVRTTELTQNILSAAARRPLQEVAEALALEGWQQNKLRCSFKTAFFAPPRVSVKLHAWLEEEYDNSETLKVEEPVDMHVEKSNITVTGDSALAPNWLLLRDDSHESDVAPNTELPFERLLGDILLDGERWVR